LSEHNWTEKYDLLLLTLKLLMTTIVAPPSNGSKWQMGFNSAFKGLNWFSALKNGWSSFHGLSMIVKCFPVFHGVVEIRHLACSPDIMTAHFFLFPTGETALKEEDSEH